MQKKLATPRYETLADYLEHALHTNRDMHICIENCPMVDILRYIKTEDFIGNLKPAEASMFTGGVDTT